MSEYSFKQPNNIIIITNPTQIPGLPEALNRIINNSNIIDNKNKEMKNVHNVNSSILDSKVKDKNVEKGNVQKMNIIKKEKKDSQSPLKKDDDNNGEKYGLINDIGDGLDNKGKSIIKKKDMSGSKYEIKIMQSKIPQRQSYIFKTTNLDACHSIFTFYISKISQLLYYFVVKVIDNKNAMYYICIIFNGRKKLASKNFIYVNMIDKNFNMLSALQYINYLGGELIFVPKTDMYENKINNDIIEKGIDYIIKEMILENEKSSINAYKNICRKKKGNANIGKPKIYWNDISELFPKKDNGKDILMQEKSKNRKGESKSKDLMDISEEEKAERKNKREKKQKESKKDDNKAKKPKDKDEFELVIDLSSEEEDSQNSEKKKIKKDESSNLDCDEDEKENEGGKIKEKGKLVKLKKEEAKSRMEMDEW